MRIDLKRSLGVASVVMAGIVLAGCASGPELPSPQQIDAARTRADHDGVAAAFAYQAEMARRDAATHRDMDKSFAALRAIGQGAYPDMENHCAAAIGKYEGMATQYDGLAADHRRMAQGVVR
ncbi:hypothetical protein RHDC3_02359 [Rhodocyclaceae bacterium]|nr:hypothetical protein RHDC3_02359 [Rhodocyclaceae bacterium]